MVQLSIHLSLTVAIDYAIEFRYILKLPKKKQGTYLIVFIVMRLKISVGVESDGHPTHVGVSTVN